MDIDSQTNLVHSLTTELGIDALGITTATPPANADEYLKWLQDGRTGEMHYLHEYVEQRIDPRVLLPGAKSIIVIACNYYNPCPQPPAELNTPARISRYAWGRDYHRVLKKKLFTLADTLKAHIDTPFECKACVDTAPILERSVAQAAGIGWIGKNTSLIREAMGSYIFLGELVTTLELTPTPPAPDRCGSCTRCIDACPTNALTAPYQVDPRKCISYLTIEHRNEIPFELADKMGNCIYGCDICQEVCPHNKKAPEATEPDFAIRPPGPWVDAAEWSQLRDDEFPGLLEGTPIKRAKPHMLRRNAAIVINNTRI